MKPGRMLTAMAIMYALSAARSKFEYATLDSLIQQGRFRHRGKGRGSVSQNFLGKTSKCRQETEIRASARRLRQIERGTLRKMNGLVIGARP